MATSEPDVHLLHSLFDEFSDVFDEEELTVMSGDPMHVHVKRDSPEYRATRVLTARSVAAHFQEEADKTIQWFLDSKVLVKVEEPTEWCSPGFFVPKPNGKVRLVVDYRDLNKYSERPIHPFTCTRDALRGVLPTSTHFIKLDAVQGYYQIPLDEASSYLTTFLLPSGRYRYLRAPMGLNSSSDAFNYKTDLAFLPVPDLVKIVDDSSR